MAIKTNTEHLGVTFTDCYVKVSKLTLINCKPKMWQSMMDYWTEDGGELLTTGKAFSFPFIEGADPLKQAYAACGVEGVEV